jgi:hypothetical protein
MGIGIVKYGNNAKEIIRYLFRRDLSDTEFAKVVGAIDDAFVLAESRGTKLFVIIKHPFIKRQDCFIEKMMMIC